MEKKIEDYLHLYLGAQHRYRYVDYEKGSWTVWSELTADRLRHITRDLSIERVQLALRPLSIMTEEEEVQWRSISSSSQFPTIKQQAEEVKYLLSKHFDLFSLIEAGLAIDASTLNQPK